MEIIELKDTTEVRNSIDKFNSRLYTALEGTSEQEYVSRKHLASSLGGRRGGNTEKEHTRHMGHKSPKKI